jgi:glycosyltransferase involved in cell wall biosynthesis
LAEHQLRLALLAPEYPPQLGGMAELARGLAEALATRDMVKVFTLKSHLGGSRLVAGSPLTGRPARDAALLRPLAPDFDAFLLMNAGLVPLAARLGKPCFGYWHGNDFLEPWLACGPAWLEGIKRPYMARLRHALRRRAVKNDAAALRHLFTNSRQTAALISARMGVPTTKISVVPPGVADAFFQERGPAGDRLRILTVSRLSRFTRRKNVDGVLEALALLGDLKVHYTLVGDGDDRPRLEARARELGVAARVDFRGSLDQRQLLEVYREADLFVLASKASAKDVEGFGIVYLEASASGVPVIASREGGATDAVQDGVNGLLLESSSPAAIAAGIRDFLARREEFTAAKARAFAEAFRWPKIAAELRDQVAARI